MGRVCVVINPYNAKELEKEQKEMIYGKSAPYIFRKSCNRIWKVESNNNSILKQKDEYLNREEYSVCEKNLLTEEKIRDKTPLVRCIEYLGEQKVSMDLVYRLLKEYDVEIVARKKYFMIRCNGDSWKIPFHSESGEVELWHNNYLIASDGSRYIEKGYHKQKNWGSTVTAALKYVMKYDFGRYHVVD